MNTNENENHSPLTSYIIGFALSLFLTLVAYFSVTKEWFSGQILYAVLGSLALLQFGVQMFYFLHLGEEPKPRFNFYVFLFTVFIVLIVVIGTIWIMYHLDRHHYHTGMHT